MAGHSWERLGDPPPGALHEARVEAHWAVQIAAAVGHTLLDPRPDGAHTALEWDVETRALVALPWNGVRVGVRPEDFALFLYDEDLTELEESTLRGRTLAQGLEFVAELLSDAADTELPRPLEVPGHPLLDHPVGRGGAFGMRTFDTHAELGRWLANGHGLLAELAGALPGTPPVRGCPHRFDLSLLIDLGGERSLALGLSPGDAVTEEPYFYAAPWPTPAAERLPALPSGEWRTGERSVALLPGAALVAAGEAGTQAERARAFLEGAHRVCVELLAASA